MFRLEEHLRNQWQPVEQHVYRTRFRALTAARTRTAQHGISHRILDLSQDTVTDVVAFDSVQRAPHHYLRCGTLGNLGRNTTGMSRWH